MTSPELSEPVYKVLLPEQYATFEASGEFAGSADDRRDGFIHLSFRAQVERTIQKHFQDRSDLFIAEFAPHTWGSYLRFEPSRDQQLFPHLYGVLQWGQVRRWVTRVEFIAPIPAESRP